jgi:hypothetical protein
MIIKYFITVLYSVIIVSVLNASENINVDTILKIFNKKAILQNEFINNPENKEKRMNIEIYSQNVYDSILPFAKKMICEENDTNLLWYFMKSIIEDSMSADEIPPTIFGEIYACKPRIIIKYYNKLSKQDKKAIYRALDFGYANEYAPIMNNKRQKEYLDSLFNEINNN